VSAKTHVHTISKEEYEQLRIHLAWSQRDNIDIQAELKTTQDKAASRDIQLITTKKKRARKKRKSRFTKSA